MNEEAKQEHVRECLSEAEQQAKWTPNIGKVHYVKHVNLGEYYEIQIVGAKNIRLDYIAFEEPKNFWARVLDAVIKNQVEMGNIFRQCLEQPKENKFPCSEYCDKLKNKEKFKTCDECTSWYKKVKINMNDEHHVTGITIEEEGTKFDAGKPRLGEMIMDFRKPPLEICKVWEFGADKYAKSNWKKVGNGEDRYTNALARHFAAEMDEGIDAETKLHHAIHVAWNAIARLYFIIKDGE